MQLRQVLRHHCSIFLDNKVASCTQYGSHHSLCPSCSGRPRTVFVKSSSDEDFLNKQGVHNLSTDNHGMHDPSLTPFGEEQCRELAQRFPYHKEMELLVTSPIRRTIYTTLLAFESDIKRGISVIALPEAQEVSDLPCDTGSDLEVLKKEMEGKPVDLSLVHEGWNNNKGKWGTAVDVIEERAKEARQWLKARPEKEIVLVTHGGFLHFFTEDWADTGKFTGTGWANVEFRSYQFNEENNTHASLEETATSRRLRTGNEIPLTETEQMELKQVAMKTWVDLEHQASSKN